MPLKAEITLGETVLKAAETPHITVINFKAGRIINEALKGLEEPAAEELRQQIQTAMNDIDWRLSIEEQGYHLTKDTVVREQIGKQERKRLQAESPGVEAPTHHETPLRKESLVVMAELSGLEEFYTRMREDLGIDIGETPPAHITLYTLDGKAGIGLNTQAMLDDAISSARDDRKEGLRAYAVEGLRDRILLQQATKPEQRPSAEPTNPLVTNLLPPQPTED